jgi:hypothetical protein
MDHDLVAEPRQATIGMHQFSAPEWISIELPPKGLLLGEELYSCKQFSVRERGYRDGSARPPHAHRPYRPLGDHQAHSWALRQVDQYPAAEQEGTWVTLLAEHMGDTCPADIGDTFCSVLAYINKNWLVVVVLNDRTSWSPIAATSSPEAFRGGPGGDRQLVKK